MEEMYIDGGGLPQLRLNVTGQARERPEAVPQAPMEKGATKVKELVMVKNPVKVNEASRGEALPLGIKLRALAARIPVSLFPSLAF